MPGQAVATSLDIRTRIGQARVARGVRATSTSEGPSGLQTWRAALGSALRGARIRASRRDSESEPAMIGNACLNSANECGKTVFLRPAPQRFAAECFGSLA